MDSIQKMLESRDIEMVRLGALLIEEKYPRDKWKSILSEMEIYHHISIKDNKIIVKESDWIFKLTSYNFIIIDFDELEKNKKQI